MTPHRSLRLLGATIGRWRDVQNQWYPLTPEGTKVPISARRALFLQKFPRGFATPVGDPRTSTGCCWLPDYQQGGRNEQVRTVSEPLFSSSLCDRVLGDCVASPARPTYCRCECPEHPTGSDRQPT